MDTVLHFPCKKHELAYCINEVLIHGPDKILNISIILMVLLAEREKILNLKYRIFLSLPSFFFFFLMVVRVGLSCQDTYRGVGLPGVAHSGADSPLEQTRFFS